MAVSAVAMLAIAASLTTIVYVRANAEREDETFTTAAAAPTSKQVKTQPVVKNANVTATATVKPAQAASAEAPAKPIAAQPAPAVQAAATELAEGDGGPQETVLVPVDEAVQAFAGSEVAANDATAVLDDIGANPTLMDSTSAIPSPRPTKGAEPKNDVQVASAAQAAAPAAGTGRILRDVTMRASGSKNAAQIATIPAKASVGVIQCKSWCQVTYKGKTGWIYKGFLDR